MAVNFISVGQRIKVIRKRRGFSQMALAELIEKSSAYISYIENGSKSLSIDTLVQIANVLNVPADELLQDNLTNTIMVSNHAFATIVSDCSEYERRVLLEAITALKLSLRNNKRFLSRR